jgi:hypothetical protein
VDELKTHMTNSLFANNQLEKLGLNMYTGWFHYKRLTWSILLDYEKAKLARESAEFRAQINQKKREHVLIVMKPSELVEQKACRFYKFLIRLQRDQILAQSEEWRAYFRFRMRHFHRIDEKVRVFVRHR